MTAQISALPTPPSTNDPANFNTRADTFLSALSTFATEANVVVGEVDANALSAASAASLASEKAAEAGARASDAAASAASALNAPGVNGSSLTSLTIAAGSKSFTTQTGKAWLAGQGFFLASSASPLNWMTGVLTAYNSATGAATIQVDTIGGSGTFAAWNCGLAAGRPLPMAGQGQAEAGIDNASWMTPLATKQAIANQAFPIGSILETAASPGARWLPCTGLSYLNSAYPGLASMMPAYVNPLTLRQSGSSYRACVYGGGVFVVWLYTGSVYNLYTSPDGVTWTQRTNPFGSTSSAVPSAVAYGSGLFIAGKPGALYTSPDGVSWTVRNCPLGASDYMTAVAYGGGRWMLIGWLSGGYTKAYTTTDLANWATQSISWNGPQCVAFSPTLSRWVVGFTNNLAAYSDDAGVSWNAINLLAPPSDNGAVNCIAWGGDRFVAVTSTGRIGYSTTGNATFTEAASVFAGSAINQVIYDGASFLACGSGGRVAQSIDASATNWVASGTGLTGDFNAIARAGSAATTPIVVVRGSAPTGIYSGLDISTTQFAVPTLAARSPLLPPYIKAL